MKYVIAQTVDYSIKATSFKSVVDAKPGFFDSETETKRYLLTVTSRIHGVNPEDAKKDVFERIKEWTPAGKENVFRIRLNHKPGLAIIHRVPNNYVIPEPVTAKRREEREKNRLIKQQIRAQKAAEKEAKRLEREAKKAAKQKKDAQPEPITEPQNTGK